MNMCYRGESTQESCSLQSEPRPIGDVSSWFRSPEIAVHASQLRFEELVAEECHIAPVGFDYDTQLMLRLRQGDFCAFEQLVERHQQRVINFAARTLGDSFEAQDVAQNVFVRVFKAARFFRFGSKFSTWLFSITRNTCLNELRRRLRHRTEALDEQGDEREHRAQPKIEFSHQHSPSQAAIGAEFLEKVNEALMDLPERQRTAILLLREGDFSYAEIASVLATSVAATKALIHSGRKDLKHKLLPYLRTGIWTESGRGNQERNRDLSHDA